MQSDVKAVKATAAAAITAAGVSGRIKGFLYARAAAAPTITFTDGSGGATVFDYTGTAGTDVATDIMVQIPGAGIYCADNIQLSVLTNVAVITVFWA